jgi:DNA repair protein RadA/Sms
VKSKVQTVFVCKSCGNEQSKWSGQCPSCGEWNALAEAPSAARPAAGRAGAAAPRRLTDFSSPVTRLSEVRLEEAVRRRTGLTEFDRILGGGVCPGSMVLLGGAPGIGKSTLMLQAADRLAAARDVVLYVSGEESPAQVKARAQRLGVVNDSLLLVSETDLTKILEVVDAHAPKVLVLDSIQTVYKPDLAGAPGAVAQIRECAAELLHLAKGKGITVFVLGHVTKDGELAGPRVLEHIVDTVLYFETEDRHVHRVLRAVKNRFGPTNEIGVFEMTAKGLIGVANPSELFLGDHGGATPAGAAVAAVMEGTRPLLVEVQALVSRTAFGMPRRQVSGLDYNRAMILIAVLDKRCGVPLDSQDVYVNAAGGLQVKEPGADLAVAAAMASAALDKPLPPRALWLGEVGLSGELRASGQAADRLAEAAKMGFERAFVAKACLKGLTPPPGLKVTGAASLFEALSAAGLAPE